MVFMLASHSKCLTEVERTKEFRYVATRVIDDNIASMLYYVITWQWLREVFLAYFDNWEKCVNERPGFSIRRRKTECC